jgi:hypothetical protein
MLAAFVFLPTAARASCGDYLHLNADAAMGNPVATHSIPNHVPTQCTGPQCSQRRNQVPIAPVVPQTTATPKWGALFTWLLVIEPDSGKLNAFPAVLHGVHRTSPPVPPPRFSVAS